MTSTSTSSRADSPNTGTVAVALSGGVDSSVAAALLVEAGHDVVGVTMRLLASDAGGADDETVASAAAVCRALGIRHEVVDLAEAFDAAVVAPFCDAYADGRTPNPCVWCNERMKAGVLVEAARALGATTLATGHYARRATDAAGAWLARARDHAKDQSYFLYRIAPETLLVLTFPLGELTKSEVRAMAAARGLPTAARRESQETCFTGDHVALVAERRPGALVPGPIEDGTGRVLGTHRGIARYTVGQRKGLGISGPDGPYVVTSIDADRNAVLVGAVDAPGPVRVALDAPVWRLGTGTHEVMAQVRYRATPVPALAEYDGARLVVTLAEPPGPLAPGQSLVLYDADRVVGGGYVPSVPLP